MLDSDAGGATAARPAHGGSRHAAGPHRASNDTGVVLRARHAAHVLGAAPRCPYRQDVDPAGLVAMGMAGLWIAYLVPQRLRYRQQLLETRHDDRFSERLRVVRVARSTAGVAG